MHRQGTKNQYSSNKKRFIWLLNNPPHSQMNKESSSVYATMSHRPSVFVYAEYGWIWMYRQIPKRQPYYVVAVAVKYFGVVAKGMRLFYLHLLLFRMYDVCSLFVDLASLALIFMNIFLFICIHFGCCMFLCRTFVIALYALTELCRCLLLMFQRHAICSEPFYILFVEKTNWRIMKHTRYLLLLLYGFRRWMGSPQFFCTAMHIKELNSIWNAQFSFMQKMSQLFPFESVH